MLVAGVVGNKHVDKLKDEAAISGNNMLLDPQAFVSMMVSHMSNMRNNEPIFLHTIQMIKDSGT